MKIILIPIIAIAALMAGCNQGPLVVIQKSKIKAERAAAIAHMVRFQDLKSIAAADKNSAAYWSAEVSISYWDGYLDALGVIVPAVPSMVRPIDEISEVE